MGGAAPSFRRLPAHFVSRPLPPPSMLPRFAPPSLLLGGRARALRAPTGSVCLGAAHRSLYPPQAAFAIGSVPARTAPLRMASSAPQPQPACAVLLRLRRVRTHALPCPPRVCLTASACPPSACVLAVLASLRSRTRCPGALSI